MSEDAAAHLAAIDRPNRLLVRVAQKTDVGLVRSENQDFAILSTPEEERLAATRSQYIYGANGLCGPTFEMIIEVADDGGRFAVTMTREISGPFSPTDWPED